MKNDKTLFQVLHKDHAEVTELLRALHDGSSERREMLFSKVQEELEVHSTAEEACVYPRLEDRPELTKLAVRSEEEHNEIRVSLSAFEGIDTDSEEWEDAFENLRSVVENHVKAEESEIFPKMEEAFDENELEEMKLDFLDTKKRIAMGKAA
jgi:hemerythrin superfamily protein